MTDGPFFRTLYLKDEEASLQLSEDLAIILKQGDVVLLSGDLGAGKTTIARGIIRALLNNPEAEVPSPTFNLVVPYQTQRFAIHHFDLYRIADPEELEEIGFFDALEEGCALVEWPERAQEVFDEDALRLAIEIDGEGRTLRLQGGSDWQYRIDRSLKIRDLLNGAGWDAASRQFLQGDASIRSYEITTSDKGDKAVLMNWPESGDGPVLKDGKTYSELAHLATSVRPFVAIGKVLDNLGLCAPAIIAQDLDGGLLLLENLGSETIAPEGNPIEERYEAAIDVLVEIHKTPTPGEIQLDDGFVHVIPHFDREIWDIETALLMDWYIPKMTERDLGPGILTIYRDIWSKLFQKISDSETGLILRDYHSPNLIWRGHLSGLNRIGLIDFQDALIGPSAYDVASLCQDARVTVSAEMEKRLKTRYVLGRQGTDPSFDRDGFEEAYAIIAAERATRLMGLWPRLKYRDGKPHYMQHMPRTIEYLERTLMHPVLIDLKNWYNEHLGFYKDE